MVVTGGIARSVAHYHYMRFTLKRLVAGDALPEVLEVLIWHKRGCLPPLDVSQHSSRIPDLRLSHDASCIWICVQTAQER